MQALMQILHMDVLFIRLAISKIAAIIPLEIVEKAFNS